MSERVTGINEGMDFKAPVDAPTVEIPALQLGVQNYNTTTIDDPEELALLRGAGEELGLSKRPDVKKTTAPQRLPDGPVGEVGRKMTKPEVINVADIQAAIAKMKNAPEFSNDTPPVPTSSQMPVVDQNKGAAGALKKIWSRMFGA